MTTAAGAVEKYLSQLNARALLLKLTWDEWLSITEPYSAGEFSSAGIKARYPRYGLGYAERYNEKIAYLWLWAHKAGYFD
jgi:hypothetical protein